MRLSVIKTAFGSLVAHSLRSVLTTLGIVAGVAAVVVVASITEGTRREVANSIATLGANRVDVNSGSKNGKVNSRLPFGGLYMLTDSDVLEISRRVRGVQIVSGFLKGSTEIRYSGFNELASWIGAGSDGMDVLGYQVALGRGLTRVEGLGAKKVVLLGAEIAQRLFGERRAVGARVRIVNSTFSVIGVLQRRGQSVAGQSLDEVMIVPIEAARRYMMGDFPLPRNAVQQIGLLVDDEEELSVVQDRITARLREAHGVRAGEGADFNVSSVLGSVEAGSRADRSMSFLLICVATVCLVVGGIGIMNIMLVSISERIGEIGLRMAVGASRREIMIQFTIEALILSVAGGVVGLLLGLVIAFGLADQQDLHVKIGLPVVVSAFVVAVVTGLVFGIWPAKRAAMFHPADALRRL